MNHPRAASRHPLKGATPADGRSPIRGVLGFDISRRRPVGGPLVSDATTGLLRTRAMASRRANVQVWRLS
jgi:hypothetical protein